MFDVLAAVKKKFNPEMMGDLQARFRSSAVMAPVALAAAIIGGLWFNLLVLAAAVLMSFEWQQITAQIEGDEETKKKWYWRGVAYITIGCASFLWLRYLETYHGGWVIIWLLVTVWITDVAAFFSGRLIGGAKLAPTISPGKTWAGLAGGMLAAAAFGMWFGISSGLPSIGIMFWLSAVTALVAQAGDLLESYIKRQCGVKDSGDLIPGHGGVMDRVDGFMTAAPFVMLVFMLMGRP